MGANGYGELMEKYLQENDPALVTAEGTFLNQELVDKGFAQIWKPTKKKSALLI